MKMPTVSLFVCAMMVLTQAATLPEAEDKPVTEGSSGEPYTDVYSWTGMEITTEEYGGWTPSCPDGWTMFDIRCLLYVRKNMTWAQAEEHCQSMQGNLVPAVDTVHDIQKVMQSAGHENGHIWVGGCDTKDPSWSWGIYAWFSDNREPFCLQITSGELESGCLKEAKCGASLPSVCSITIM